MNTVLTTQAARPQLKFALLVLAGGLLGALGAGAASAGAADDTVPSVVVRYNDLSLATDEGVQTLYRRIAHAAARVCPDETIANLSVHPVIQACRQQAIAKAVQQIHNSRLAALYAAHAKQG
jgi:UrcA family protein